MRRSSSRQREKKAEQSGVFELGGAATKKLYDQYKDFAVADIPSSSGQGRSSASSKGKGGGSLAQQLQRLKHTIWLNKKNRLLFLGTAFLLSLTLMISASKRKGPSAKKKPSFMRKRWNPCTDTLYEWERHDHEARHGDVCRAKGKDKTKFQCPDGCSEALAGAQEGGWLASAIKGKQTAPYCVNMETDVDNPKSKTRGGAGEPCRVRNPSAPPEYRCDYGGVCILSTGTPREEFKGKGKFLDDTCDNKCGDGRKGDLTAWIHHGGMCSSDKDCSLAGVCNDAGTCDCDPWADGVDCSYLKFAPVDRSKLGYIDEEHSSWGGSVVQSMDGKYHMYVSEIRCSEGSKEKRCGLTTEDANSRLVHATSSSADGPYKRVSSDASDVLPLNAHNPSVHISPQTGDWHLYLEMAPSEESNKKGGPIIKMISNDRGSSWSKPLTALSRKNPGPLLKEDGSTLLFYTAVDLDLPPPTCSSYGIAMTQCPDDHKPCKPPQDEQVLDHTGEDPSIFRDHRGNYHMLFNALPYQCKPKFEGGGHAWSEDGVTWKSSPRVGAFDATIKFTDGTSMKCERRERPQMIVDDDGKPVAMVSAVSGCPVGLGRDTRVAEDGSSFYKGGDDSFTLVQIMGEIYV